MTIHLVNPSHLLISKGYPQMYATTGIATDSARVSRQVLGATDRQALPAPVCRPSATWAHENHRGCVMESVSVAPGR
jgi:hypothetical protein